MLSVLLAIAPIFSQEPAPGRSPTLTGNIRKIPDFESKILGNKRNLVVYLPPDYEEKELTRYPVL